MATIETLSVGQAHTLDHTGPTVYALPAKRCLLQNDGNGTINLSPDNVTFVAATLDSNKQISVAGGFIKATVADAVIRLAYY